MIISSTSAQKSGSVAWTDAVWRLRDFHPTTKRFEPQYLDGDG